VETVVPRVQKLAGRVGDPDKAAAIIDYTTDREVMTGLFFMVGFPTETFDEAMTTLEYVRARRHATMPYFFSVKYFPGTELTRLAIDCGAIGPEAAQAACLPYHDVSRARTSTLSPEQFQILFTFYMKEILLNGERIVEVNCNNAAFYSNPEVNDLLREAAKETDAEARLGIYQQVERMIVDDAPWVFLYHPVRHALRQPWLRGHAMHPVWPQRLEKLWFDETDPQWEARP